MSDGNASNDDRLLRLYSCFAQDEYELIKALQNYLKLFSSLILAVIGGAFFIFDKIDNVTIRSLGFFIGGCFVIGISYLGYNAAKSNYRRQLESIVKRFKIECLLDLDNVTNYSDDNYMINEPLILDRYKEDFEPYEKESSTKFVNDKLKLGFMKVIVWFYSLTAIIGLILTLIGIILFIDTLIKN